VERYVVLLCDKISGNIIEFTDLGDSCLNFHTFEEEKLTSHILVFLLRGVVSNLKYSFGYFATQSLKAHKLMSLSWEAVQFMGYCYHF